MTVKITKPQINVREELNDLKKPTGVAGEAMLRAETPQEQQALVGVGRKNLIFNGAMNISQRGTTFDKNSFTGSKYYSLDRFHIQSSTPSHDHTVTQSTDAPDGFSHSFKYTQDTAASSYPATSSQYHRIRHQSEGQNCKQIENANCVLTFYVKSSIAGQFDVTLFAPDSSPNHMVLPYTINNSNTWEKKELRFTGPSTISRTNALSFDVQWQLARAGTSYQSTTAGVWGATKLSSSNSTDAIIKTAGATWQLTGVQLEIGKVATPFEHRSYGEELALCQRYYQTTFEGYTAPTATFDNQIMFYPHATTSYAQETVYLPVRMRTYPTTNIYSGISTTSGKIGNRDNSSTEYNGVATGGVSQIFVTVQNTSIGQSVGLGFHYTVDAEL